MPGLAGAMMIKRPAQIARGRQVNDRARRNRRLGEAPCRITIEISASGALEIQSLVDRMNQHDNLECGTSHGEMTMKMKKLITLLAEDAALVESRPGSWEGRIWRLCCNLMATEFNVATVKLG